MAGGHPADVGEQHLGGRRRASEGEAGSPADRAAAAVTADQVVGVEMVGARRPGDECPHAARGPGEPDDAVPAPDPRAEPGRPLGQHLLDLGLPDQGGRPVGVERAQVQPTGQQGEVPGGGRSQPVPEQLQQAPLVPCRQGGGVHTGCPGLPGRPLERLEDDDLDAGEAQLAGEHEAGGAGTDDDDVGTLHPVPRGGGWEGCGRGHHRLQTGWASGAGRVGATSASTGSTSAANSFAEANAASDGSAPNWKAALT